MVIFVLFFPIIFKTNAIPNNCNFGEKCSGITITFKDSDDNVEVVGVHGYSSNIERITLANQNLKFFPQQIEKFFSNLIEIDLQRNAITSVTNNHLRPHQKLKELYLQHNQIAVLESNIFDGMAYLRNVNFDYNNIKHVNYDVKLPAYFVLSIKRNPCVDESFWDFEQIDLSSSLQDQCPPLTLRATIQQGTIPKLQEQKSETNLTNLTILTDNFNKIIKECMMGLNGTTKMIDDEVISLNRTIKIMDDLFMGLNETVTLINIDITRLNRTLTMKDKEFMNLNATIHLMEDKTMGYSQTIKVIDDKVTRLNRTITMKYDTLGTIQLMYDKILFLNQTIKLMDEEVVELRNKNFYLETIVVGLDKRLEVLEEKNVHLANGTQ